MKLKKLFLLSNNTLHWNKYERNGCTVLSETSNTASGCVLLAAIASARPTTPASSNLLADNFNICSFIPCLRALHRGWMSLAERAQPLRLSVDKFPFAAPSKIKSRTSELKHYNNLDKKIFISLCLCLSLWPSSFSSVSVLAIFCPSRISVVSVLSINSLDRVCISEILDFLIFRYCRQGRSHSIRSCGKVSTPLHTPSLNFFSVDWVSSPEMIMH